MLDSLTQRLTKVVKTIRGQARLTESNMQDMLREIRIALLEADVAIPVVKDLIARIKEKALGTEVQTSLTPGQALVGIVHDELTKVIGGEDPENVREINLATQPPAIILLAGLQGAGKTTTAGKLGKWLKEEKKKKVLTVSADVYRPAAIDQLQTVSQQANIDFFPSTPNEKPLDIARKALEYAKLHYYDVLIVDTAGRLAIDEQMMNEVSDLEKFLNPIETFFVVDAMVGQDAVNTAKAFGEKLPLTGVILTKVDGDSRGGAALSVRMVTGKPIKFMGVGEKLNGFQRFDPQAMAGRILGMGDVVSLVERAQEQFDEEEAKRLEKKIRKNQFDFNDFYNQIQQIKKMGNIKELASMIPGVGKAIRDVDIDDNAFKGIEAIIQSMTPQERTHPEVLNTSRRRRIASGSGTSIQEVNKLIKQFDQTRKMMKMVTGANMKGMMGRMKNMKGTGMPPMN